MNNQNRSLPIFPSKDSFETDFGPERTEHLIRKIQINDFLDYGNIEISFLYPNETTVSSLHMIYGNTGSGKTLLTYSIADLLSTDRFVEKSPSLDKLSDKINEVYLGEINGDESRNFDLLLRDFYLHQRDNYDKILRDINKIWKFVFFDYDDDKDYEFHHGEKYNNYHYHSHLPYLVSKNKDFSVPFSSMSRGQRTVFRMLWMILCGIKNADIFIIDLDLEVLDKSIIIGINRIIKDIFGNYAQFIITSSRLSGWNPWPWEFTILNKNWLHRKMLSPNEHEVNQNDEDSLAYYSDFMDSFEETEFTNSDGENE
jgi:hypothetical protein